MLELLMPIMDYLIIAVVTAFAWFANNKYQQSKGKKEAEQDAMEESFRSAEDAKQDLEDIRSASDDDFIAGVRDNER